MVSLTSTRPGTDVVAMTSAALAAASIAIREESSQVCLRQTDSAAAKGFSTYITHRLFKHCDTLCNGSLASSISSTQKLRSKIWRRSLTSSCATTAAEAVTYVTYPALQTSDVYLARSIALYRLALRWPKQTYNRFVETSSLYPSASMYDDMAYAAAW